MLDFGIKINGLARSVRAVKYGRRSVFDVRRQVVRGLSTKVKRAMVKNLKKGRKVSGRSPPLSPMTILIRKHAGGGGRSPLYEYGDLARGIRVRFSERFGVAEVGYRKGDKNRDGGDLALIAMWMEFGTKPYTITVTTKMRKFFYWLSIVTNGKIKPIPLSKSEIFHPGIPARPFVGPVAEQIDFNKEVFSSLNRIRF